MASDSGADLRGVGDKGRTIGHVDGDAPVKERGGEYGLLRRGETDRVVQIVTDLAKGGEAHGLGARERVGANRVFPAVAKEPSSHESGAPF